MKYTNEQKKALFDKAEELMKHANIQIRDTWDGYDGENYDDLIKNEGRSDGQKSIDIVKTKDGKASLETKHYQLETFKSLSYEESRILIPEHLADNMHPLIHEAVHFLQHNTEELDKSWSGLKSKTKEDFRAFVDQRSEQEAHFVQLLYINENELNVANEEIKKEFKKRLTEGLMDSSKRTDLIVWAQENEIFWNGKASENHE